MEVQTSTVQMATTGGTPRAVRAITEGVPMAAAVAVEDNGVATMMHSTQTSRIISGLGRLAASSALLSCRPTPSWLMMSEAASAAKSEMPTVANWGISSWRARRS